MLNLFRTRQTPCSEMRIAAPLGSGHLGRDPPRPEARVAEGEGDDPVLEAGADLVGRPRPAALAGP
jgi:hypothetical protein